MSSQQLRADLTDLATRLELHGLTTIVERLHNLAVAVGPSGDVARWSGVDIFTALDPRSTADRVRNKTLQSVRLGHFEMLRNVLVLIPILLTWLGLMYASFAYRQAIANDPSLIDRPFLLLWEEQFGGSLDGWLAGLSWLTLSVVAIIDVMVIGAMIALTFFIHHDRNVRQTRREREADDIEEQLTHVAWQASSYISGLTSPHAVAARFSEATDGLLSALEAHRAEIDLLAQFRQREIADLQTFAADLKQGSSELRTAVQQTTVHLNALADIGAILDTRLIELRDTDIGLRSAFEVAATDITMLARASQAHASAASTVAHGIDVLREEVHELRTQAIERQDAFVDAIVATAHLSDALERSSDRALDVVKQIDSVTQSVTIVPSQLSSAAAAMERAAANIAHSIPSAELSSAASAHRDAADGLLAAASELAQPSRRMETAASLQADAAHALRDAADRMTTHGAVRVGSNGRSHVDERRLWGRKRSGRR